MKRLSIILITSLITILNTAVAETYNRYRISPELLVPPAPYYDGLGNFVYRDRFGNTRTIKSQAQKDFDTQILLSVADKRCPHQLKALRIRHTPEYNDPGMVEYTDELLTLYHNCFLRQVGGMPDDRVYKLGQSDGSYRSPIQTGELLPGQDIVIPGIIFSARKKSAGMQHVYKYNREQQLWRILHGLENPSWANSAEDGYDGELW
jgi:hypothetical protein